MTSILNVPPPTSAPRQKSIDVSDLFLTRFTPPWSRPASLPAYNWRMWVLNQPVAIVCRETLIANLLALDWKITPVDSKYKEELDPTIKYYTKLLKGGGNYSGLSLDFSGLIEWIVGDLLDTPFGGAAEIGRKGGSESGRVQWIRPLDAGTLFPTLNQEFPIVQYYPNISTDIVVFHPWEISRTYMSPHSFILREGWGMAPPEKVYFALDLLTKGDKYYANLLLDIPTAGILDLGDMEKSAAEDWITAFKTFVNDNTTSFKVPVLYEHNNEVKFLPFGKVPNDIMFNHITLKYAALVAAAYGMSLSDIGLGTTSASGETLAGSIRQERRTRKTGFARVKAKTKSFFDSILPSILEFNWIDYDDELNVALGKARLASSQALKTWQDAGVISVQEHRSQIIQDGLMSIALPDEVPPDAKPLEDQNGFGNKVGGNTEPEMINPGAVAPSSGGDGEIKSFTVRSKHKGFNSVVEEISKDVAHFVINEILKHSEDDLPILRSQIGESLFGDDIFNLQSIISAYTNVKPFISLSLVDLENDLLTALGDGYDGSTLKPYMDRFKSDVIRSLSGFIGRIVAYLANDAVFDNALFLSNSNDAVYDVVIKSVKSNLELQLKDYIGIHINSEAQKLIQRIRLEN